MRCSMISNEFANQNNSMILCLWTFRCPKAEAGVFALSQMNKGLRIVILTPLTENKNSESFSLQKCSLKTF